MVQAPEIVENLVLDGQETKKLCWNYQ